MEEPRPGPRNALTDVAGLRVGNAQDVRVRTGVTVVIPDVAVLAAVDVRGGAPGTINSEALAAGGLVDTLHAVVLAGGSAFGLSAATSLMEPLARDGRGFRDWGPTVPLVAGAILFDLANGGEKSAVGPSLYSRLALEAYAAAGPEPALGKVGAGYGALAGPLEGGLGTASVVDPATGVTIGALVAVNSLGGVTFPDEPAFLAGHLALADELGEVPPPRAPAGARFETKRGLGQGRLGGNTTIGVVATDAALDRDGLRRLAAQGQSGLAQAIRPVHTLFDGDTLFALATRAVRPPERPDLLIRLGALAADCVARAVMRGVQAAVRLGEAPCWRERLGQRST
ncbi:MAG: P1 family peptidase [Geminicoccaceae bacterium]|nr:P1 family peptidase [Geminicoccaceae bacterium]